MKYLNSKIKTQRTILRKYVKADRENFADLFLDKDVNHFMGGKCSNRDEAYSLFDKGFEIYNGLLLPRHFELWAITVKNKFIGHFELKESENTGIGELEIVYLLNKDFWGQGIMPEIISEINKYASLKNRKLVATISPDNFKTVKALNKIGIDREKFIGEGDERSLKVWIKQPIKEK